VSQNNYPSNRPVWLAIMLIVAVLVAAATALLFHQARDDMASTLTAAGSAFVATITLSIGAGNFLRPRE
jgi:hypothetical protein